MGWEALYAGVYDAINTALSALVTAGNLGQVGVAASDDGRGAVMRKWPLAIIRMGEAQAAYSDSEQLADAGKIAVAINAKILVICRDTEPENWMEALITPMSDIVDKIHADVTLGGKAFDTLCPVTFSPGQVEYAGKLYWGGVVGLRAIVTYTPAT
jgi:hypothetical protein